MSGARQAHERAGRRAEGLARLFLALKGYRCLGQRLKTPLGEIDLVVRKGTTLAIVEVKRRRTLDEAHAAISARQQARLVNAARHLLSTRPELCGLTVRFDAVLLAPGRWPVHILSAFEVP